MDLPRDLLMKTKVLLVEDDEAHVNLFLHALNDIGPQWYQITAVSYLADAIAHLKQERYDVIVLDLGLPDGHDSERTFDDIHQYATDTPVIILTGRSEESLALRLLHKGAQEFLHKHVFDDPIALPAVLARVIRYSMERQSSRNVQKIVVESQESLHQFNARLDEIDKKLEAMSRYNNAMSRL